MPKLPAVSWPTRTHFRIKNTKAAYVLPCGRSDAQSLAMRGEGGSVVAEGPCSGHFRLHRQNDPPKNRSCVETKPCSQARCSSPNPDVEGGSAH